MPLKMMYITNNPKIAIMAENAGVDRIWIDLEQIGKKERQMGMNTVQSRHTLNDITVIKEVLKKSKLQVRVNPIHKYSEFEIDTAIDNGAEIIMLPMFKEINEVEKFIKIVNKRAKVLLLLETKEAEEKIDDMLMIEGIDEIHIGLNDLHIAHNMQFMFELLADGTVKKLCDKIMRYNIPYGFGGIARLGGGGEGMLPAEFILAEHYYLNSSMVILSRSFFNGDELVDNQVMQKVFIKELAKIRNMEKELENKELSFFKENHMQLQQKVKCIVENIRNRGI